MIIPTNKQILFCELLNWVYIGEGYFMNEQNQTGYFTEEGWYTE